ncbi:hypothetical protein [Ruania alba]|uniref:Uncharacterized protein n=1 Tax=Ruania alba TaxID=648782 RepID=A0A1H5CFS1_9MICO|nr:hypothetical protein [Ruania alba]SED65455.1 hypothetical protein SAMN04488554_0357 [Ruania alba]
MSTEHEERPTVEEGEPTMSTSPASSVHETETMNSVSYGGAADPAQPQERGPRLRTVVWGLVLILLGAVVIAIGMGVQLDPTVVFIGILAIAGATLLIGALVSAARGR